jgi:hypothetical protein
MWRWSDYKANWKKIFFVPPVRESGQNKAMFKGINRWSIAGINVGANDYSPLALNFLQTCIKEEKILALTLAKVLRYNLEEIGFKWKLERLEIEY